MLNMYPCRTVDRNYTHQLWEGGSHPGNEEEEGTEADSTLKNFFNESSQDINIY